jgi:hypothetical protein
MNNQSQTEQQESNVGVDSLSFGLRAAGVIGLAQTAQTLLSSRTFSPGTANQFVGQTALFGGAMFAFKSGLISNLAMSSRTEDQQQALKAQTLGTAIWGAGLLGAYATTSAAAGNASNLLAQSSAFEGEGFLANQLRSGAIADSIALSALPFAAAPLTSMAGRASHFRVLQDSAIPAPSSSVQTQQDPQSSQDSQEDDSQGAQVNLAQSARQSGIMMADDILIAVTRSARPLDTEGIALGLSRAL